MPPIRKLFTNKEITTALTSHDTVTAAAAALSELHDVTVGSQLLTYWKAQLETKTKTGKTPASFSATNNKIRKDMKLRKPKATDDLRTTDVEQDNSRILVIPDQHAPYVHKDALRFLTDVAALMNPTRVINLGDETDKHAMSMHDSDPNLDSAGAELVKSRVFLHALEKLFPTMDICHSNHGSMVFRRAKKFGIPLAYIKSYREVLFPDGGGQGWEWKEKIKLRLPNGNRVIFQHQSAGDTLSNAAHERACIVEGHEHGKFEIRMNASTSALYWAMTSGCLVDNTSMAFAYGKDFPKKPIIGCSAIINSQPILISMPLTRSGRYTGKLDGLIIDVC